MTNLQSKPRWQLVLDALRAAGERGVLTADLENAAVGGTAGTARVRELRGRGYQIDAVLGSGTSQFRYILRGEPEPLPVVSPLKVREAVIKIGVSPEAFQPFVLWRRKAHGLMGNLNGCTLTVSNRWGSLYYWCTTLADGTQVSGRTSDEESGKRRAVEAALK
jgi:hypothetical protein